MLHLILASIGAFYSVLGFWQAWGKEPWLWRTGAFCLALALLVPIRAYEPLVFFALMALMLVVAAWLQRLLLLWKERPEDATADTASGTQAARPRQFQFRLQDLLGLMAFVGATLWMARIVWREQVLLPSLGTSVSATVAAVITLSTMGVARGPRRLASGAVLFVVIAASVVYFHMLHRMGSPAVRYLFDGELAYQVFWEFGEQQFWNSARPAVNLLVLLLALSVFVAAYSASAREIKRQTSARSLRLQTIAAIVAVLGWTAMLGWLYVRLLGDPVLPDQGVERPNALPQILQRGRPLESLSGAPARVLGAELVELSKQPGFASVPWHEDFVDRRSLEYTQLPQAQLARSIARGLDAEASALEAADPDSAADHLMAIIRIGHMLQHEGLVIDYMVGTSLEGWGLTRLTSLRKRLSPGKARQLMVELHAVEKARSRFEDAVGRSELWESLNRRWSFVLRSRIVGARMRLNTRSTG